MTVLVIFIVLAAVVLAVSYAAYRIPFYHPDHSESPYDLPPEEQYDRAHPPDG